MLQMTSSKLLVVHVYQMQLLKLTAFSSNRLTNGDYGHSNSAYPEKSRLKIRNSMFTDISPNPDQHDSPTLVAFIKN